MGPAVFAVGLYRGVGPAVFAVGVCRGVGPAVFADVCRGVEMIAILAKARRITCILLHVSTSVTAVKSTND